MSGSLDQPEGSSVQRKIHIEDVTGDSISTIESNYNNNYGKKGWRIIQIIELGSKTYIVSEKEI